MYARFGNLDRMKDLLVRMEEMARAGAVQWSAYDSLRRAEALLRAGAAHSLVEEVISLAYQAVPSERDDMTRRMQLLRARSLELELRASEDPASPGIRPILDDVIEYARSPRVRYEPLRNALRSLLSAGVAVGDPRVADLIEAMWGEAARVMEFDEYDLSDELAQLSDLYALVRPDRAQRILARWGRRHKKPKSLLSKPSQKASRPGPNREGAPDAAVG